LHLYVRSKADYSEYVREGVVANSLGMLLVVLAITLVFIVANPNYRRQPLPEEETIALTN